MRARFIPCCTALAVLATLSLVPAIFADPSGGAISGVARAPAGGATVHTVVYRGGEQADFSIQGDGDTTLNIIVKDANGFEIARTRGPGDRCHVAWRPATTGVFQIYVVNEGGVYNQYNWRAY